MTNLAAIFDAPLDAGGHRLPPDDLTPRRRLLRSLGALYVKRAEDLALLDLANDMVDRTLVEPEGRALILPAPSGAGKTTLIKHTAARIPDLSLTARDGRPPGMIFVQVPAACSLSDLGVEIARAAGHPVKAGLKANVAWGAALRIIKLKRIRFLWIDEFQNVTELANVREARKIRNTVKMSLINIRHTMGLILSGDTSITEFLRSDKHIARRSDVMTIAPVEQKMFKVVAETIRKLARKADMTTAPNLEGEIVPRLVHAALGQFGTSIEMTRATLLRATRHRPDGAEPGVLTIGHFAYNWAKANDAAADENPFVSRRWAEIDCAAVLARVIEKRNAVASTPKARPRQGRLSP